MRTCITRTLAVLSIVVTFGAAHALDERGCVPYGDEEGSFTWRLCPGGVAHERQYGYWGIWSEFYRIQSWQAPCRWDDQDMTWGCRDSRFVCTPVVCAQKH